MRPVGVFAEGPGSEIEQLRADLHGRWRQATRAVMVLLSLHGLAPAQIAALLECHPATVRRWIGRFNGEGLAGLADRPRCGWPRLGGRRLTDDPRSASFRLCSARAEHAGPLKVTGVESRHACVCHRRNRRHRPRAL
jgi:hypothetical protein